MDSVTANTARYRHNLAWSAARNWTVRLGSILTFVVLARILDPHEIGLFSAVLAIVAVAELIGENGAGEAVVQTEKIDEHILSAISIINISIAACVVLALIISASYLERFFSAPGLGKVLLPMTVVILLNACNYVSQAVLRRRFEYKWLATRAITATLISSATGIAMASAGYGVWSMVTQALTFSLINFVILQIKRPNRWLVRPNFTDAYPLFKFGWAVFCGNVLQYLSSRAIELALTFHFGPAVLALYVIGSRFYFVTSQLLSSVLLDVSFNTFSRIKADLHSLRTVALRTMAGASLVSVPIFMGMSAVAPELCELVFGAKGRAAAPFLTAVAMFGSFLITHFLNGSIIRAVGRPRIVTAFLVLQSVLSLIVYLPNWSLEPVNLIILANLPILIVYPFQLHLARRLAAISLRDSLGAIFAPYAAGGIMWAGVQIARPILPGGHPLGALAQLTLLGAILYIASVLVLTPRRAKDQYISYLRKLSNRVG